MVTGLQSPRDVDKPTHWMTGLFSIPPVVICSVSGLCTHGNTSFFSHGIISVEPILESATRHACKPSSAEFSPPAMDAARGEIDKLARSEAGGEATTSESEKNPTKKAKAKKKEEEEEEEEEETVKKQSKEAEEEEEDEDQASSKERDQAGGGRRENERRPR
ncbi:hypothetical protein WH47_03022 [Habropoda laboriosa]|uniref:Uncharacterized protein n=1 Tax=Habropoda laboriosa TaxID=597456 RepID=A0A0L7QT16_9HYME|nr:hypothetical protein WH47_03022 [Habropoda laboriosa]